MSDRVRRVLSGQLIAAMDERGVSVDELATALAMPNADLVRILECSRPTTISELCTMASYLDTDAWQLVSAVH